MVKADWYRSIIASEGGYPSTFTAIDRSVHSYKRRMLSNAFSEQALRDMEYNVIANIQKWTDRLGEDIQDDGWTLSHNVGTLASYLVFDVLTDLCFGRCFDLLGSDKMRFMSEMLPTAVRAIYEVL